ncbi:DUF6397 family protein [Streptomyces jumonjinensis]|uniref:DUF6397 family protein n=3 Tax=Streptomyces jumonjinensis TaxID=1945 RepID=UPI00332A908F
MAVRDTLTHAGAARLLELRRAEFDLAVRLGHIRTTTAGDGGGPPGVAREEIDRLRAAPGFPGELRQRVRTVGTKEGAELLSVSPGRFTRLARMGCVAPIAFYLNRYHAVVWLYLAQELTDFGRMHPRLLSGRTPPAQRALLDAGEDRRPRTWRGRRLGLLLRSAPDPWQRAAAVAAVLDPLTLVETVTDAHERARLQALRPGSDTVEPQSPAAREVLERLMTADHPDEIRWHRTHLAQLLREARGACPAARPAVSPVASGTAFGGSAGAGAPCAQGGGRTVRAGESRSAPTGGVGAGLIPRGGRPVPVRRRPDGRGLLGRLRLRGPRARR